ncbi:MAG: hypothetical protein NTY85_03520 [Actinobacteria bacterium]|nr:hypothetical protein [Actinomycetota bacterium]
MKKLTLAIVLGFTLLSAAPQAQAADSITQLAAKIKKAGIGCNDAKVTKDKILYSGKRVTCTVNGEKLNIESYTAKNFKAANKYVCDMGITIPTVSDGKTWMISFDTDETGQAIATALKAKIMTFC